MERCASTVNGRREREGVAGGNVERGGVESDYNYDRTDGCVKAIYERRMGKVGNYSLLLLNHKAN